MLQLVVVLSGFNFAASRRLLVRDDSRRARGESSSIVSWTESTNLSILAALDFWLASSVSSEFPPPPSSPSSDEDKKSELSSGAHGGRSEVDTISSICSSYLSAMALATPGIQKRYLPAQFIALSLLELDLLLQEG